MSELNDRLAREIERISPSDYLTALDRLRAYDGQPHTSLGERGATEIKGITMRDLRDCFIRACFEVSTLSPKDYPRSLYDLDWEKIDPLAIIQDTLCWVEKYMGIYPNVPEIVNVWDYIPLIDLGDSDLLT